MLRHRVQWECPICEKRLRKEQRCTIHGKLAVEVYHRTAAALPVQKKGRSVLFKS